MPVPKRLFGYLRPHWRQLILIAVLLLMWTGLELLPPLFQRAIIDDVVSAADTSRLTLLVLGLVGACAALCLVSAGDLYLRHALGECFILNLRRRVYAYLQGLSLSYFECTSTGEIMSRVTNDVNIRNADKIIALEDGRIREVGDHRELMARGGLYSHLYQRQVELTSLEQNGD